MTPAEAMRRAMHRVFLSAAIAAAPLAASAQEVAKDTFGAWTILCNQTNEDACVMQQTGKGAQGNDVLDVRVRKLEGVTAEGGEPVPAAIQIAAPLGVLLRAGVRVQVDAREQRGAPFELCIQGGCVVRDVMSADFLAEMKAGSTAKMTVVSPQAGEVSVNVSLSGFTAAFNSLPAVAAQ